MKLHNTTSMKVHLKNMQRVLNDSFKRTTYGKKEFERFILSCLNKELVEQSLSPNEKLLEEYCERA